jgi:hypothetical protein
VLGSVLEKNQTIYLVTSETNEQVFLYDFRYINRYTLYYIYNLHYDLFTIKKGMKQPVYKYNSTGPSMDADQKNSFVLFLHI